MFIDRAVASTSGNELTESEQICFSRHLVSSDMFPVARLNCALNSAAENVKEDFGNEEDSWLQLRLGNTSSGSVEVTSEIGFDRNRYHLEKQDSSSIGYPATLQLLPAKMPNVDIVLDKERSLACSTSNADQAQSTGYQRWEPAEGRSGSPPPSSAKIRRVQHEGRRAAAVGFLPLQGEATQPDPLAANVREHAALACTSWNQLAAESWQALVRRFSTSLYVQGYFPPAGQVLWSRVSSAAQQRSCPSPPPSSPSPRLVSPPASRGHAAGIWFSLEASRALKDDDEYLPSIDKMYMRVRNGEVPISTVKKYLMSKLGLSSEEQVEFTCRGKSLASNSTLQHVRDEVWNMKDIQTRISPFTPKTSKDQAMILFLSNKII